MGSRLQCTGYQTPSSLVSGFLSSAPFGWIETEARLKRLALITSASSWPAPARPNRPLLIWFDSGKLIITPDPGSARNFYRLLLRSLT